MTDDELLAARVKRIISAEHVLAVVERYAKKWHELEKIKQTPGDSSFTSGRQVGYVEVLSALLDVPHGQVSELLRNGQL